MAEDISALPAWTLVDRLIKSRVQARLSQPRLAEELGMSAKQVYRYETGEHEPSRGTLLLWAQITKVSYDWLIGIQTGPTIPAKLDRRRRSARTVTGRYNPSPGHYALLLLAA